MEWLQTPPAQPKVACGVRVCWDMEDKDPYPDPCGLQVCIIKFCLQNFILPSVVIFNIFPPILPGIFLAIMLYVFAYTAMRSVLYKTGMAFKEGQSVFFKKLSQQLTAIKLIKLFDLSDLFADLLNSP